MMDSRERNSLDRYITGNYGEDQFRETPKGDVTVKGVIFKFVRRRYNRRKTFTWLHWLDEDDKWQEYRGDPWPSVRIPNADLERIATELLAEIDAKYGPYGPDAA